MKLILDKIKFWWKSIGKYQLSEHEASLWCAICEKADIGYQEWLEQTKGDDLCGPWITNITSEEVALIDKIHEKFYGKDWYIVMPVSVSQCCYVEYWDIKNKVIYENGRY